MSQGLEAEIKALHDMADKLEPSDKALFESAYERLTDIANEGEHAMLAAIVVGVEMANK